MTKDYVLDRASQLLVMAEVYLRNQLQECEQVLDMCRKYNLDPAGLDECVDQDKQFLEEVDAIKKAVLLAIRRSPDLK